jgi:Putative quorum-sensing-regulated virulence factor
MERMTFGKHRGEPVEDVPTNYLEWAIRTCNNLDFHLRDAIQRELSRRARAYHRGETADGRSRPPADWSGIISRWHHELVLIHHPDRGGDVRVMQALNDAADRLRKLVGA